MMVCGEYHRTVYQQPPTTKMWEDLSFNGGMLATKLNQSMQQDQITELINSTLFSILKCFDFGDGSDENASKLNMI